MYSLAVGACASAAIGELFSQYQSVFRTLARPVIRTSQYVFIVTTIPASNASQCRFGTKRGAAANMAMHSTSLTNSQANSLAIAPDACAVLPLLRATPRANNAAGTTMANAP